MGVRRTGDWDKARAKLTTGMGPRLATALRQATIRNALFFWCARFSGGFAPRPRADRPS